MWVNHWISFVAPFYLLKKQRGEVHKISSKFILCDHVPNYCDHPVSQSSDLMEKNLMQITLVDYRVNHNFECRFYPNTRTYTTANLKIQRVFVDYFIGTLFHGSLILCFSQLWKNRDRPQIKISAKFNTHVENSNYRKKWITLNNYNWLYMIHVDKFDMLLAGFTGTFHSMTVSSVVK